MVTINQVLDQETAMNRLDRTWANVKAVQLDDPESLLADVPNTTRRVEAACAGGHLMDRRSRKTSLLD